MTIEKRRRASMASTILADLRRAQGAGWLCGSVFYASYRPTFSQRISELNAAWAAKHDGEVMIASRICTREGHVHASTVHEYRLAAKPEQLVLVAS